MDKIYICAGQYMYEALKDKYNNCIPFNDALINGINDYDLFSDNFINQRCRTLNTSLQEYREKMDLFIKFINNLNDFNEVHLCFGSEPFCLANLIGILAYLELQNYQGLVIYKEMDENTNRLVNDYQINLNGFIKVYNELNKLIDKNDYLESNGKNLIIKK